MSSNLSTRYSSWFNRTIFIDANDFELAGYAIIGPLLHFYTRVVIHSPAEGLALQAVQNPQYAATSLSPKELRRAALEIENGAAKPSVGFTMFPTWADAAYREGLKLLGLRVWGEFDRDVINKASSLQGAICEVPDARACTAKAAFAALDDVSFVGRIAAEIENYQSGIVSLPPRFAAACAGKLNWPRPLIKYMVPSLTAPQRVALLSAYDMFNDKWLQAHAEAQHSAPTTVGAVAADFLHGIVPAFEDLRARESSATGAAWLAGEKTAPFESPTIRELYAILEPCFADARPLSLKDILVFRKTYRLEFLESTGAVLAETAQIADPETRVSRCRELAVQRLKGPWLASGARALLAGILNVATLGKARDDCAIWATTLQNALGKRYHLPFHGEPWTYWFNSHKSVTSKQTPDNRGAAISSVHHELGEAIAREEFRKEVFLAHAHEDEVLAGVIHRLIQSTLGADVFRTSKFDAVSPGQLIREGIFEAHKRAKIILVLLTPNSFMRPWVMFEAGGAYFQESKELFVVCAGGFPPGEAPGPIHAQSIKSLGSCDEADSICREMGRVLGRRYVQDRKLLAEVVSSAAPGTGDWGAVRQTMLAAHVGESPFDYLPLIQKARSEFILVGMNLWSLTCDPKSEHSRKALFEFLSDPSHSAQLLLCDPASDSAIRTWAGVTGDRFIRHLSESLWVLKQWDARAQSKGLRLEVKVAKFVPLSFAIIDPRSGNGLLAITPVVGGSTRQERPTFAIRERDLEEVFRYYYNRYTSLYAEAHGERVRWLKDVRDHEICDLRGST